ncbi:MAG: TIR domain-containing protein [Deltaproteobacteria bacterium]|nr:TIR domain-containing protein [Deltaproteobacteria bacterium]MBW1794842.1 TIR domain-containing protein [Deltaproteobacteria bacterium]
MNLSEVQLSILKVVLDIQGPSGAYGVRDSRIAARLDIDPQEVQDHLDILEEDGYVQLARASGPTYSIWLTARGRMVLRELKAKNVTLSSKSIGAIRKLLQSQSRSSIKQLLLEAGADSENILKVPVVGNTRSPKYLSKEELITRMFDPIFTDYDKDRANEVLIDLVRLLNSQGGDTSDAVSRLAEDGISIDFVASEEDDSMIDTGGKANSRNSAVEAEAHTTTRMTAEYDVFICHAGEDKEAVVEPLAQEFRNRGLRVWYDRWLLRIGDSLRRKIDEGLSQCKYGVVVLSPNFFGKLWPERELDGLVQREMSGQKVILPIWHNVNYSDVASYSLPLADRMAGSTRIGIPQLANELMHAIREGSTDAPISISSDTNDTTLPAELQITYRNVTISSELHRYSLVVNLTLKQPPDQGRFRLEILWPFRVRISTKENLDEIEKQHIESLEYRKLRLESQERIFPGESRRIIGPESLSKLEYEFDDEIWAMTKSQPLEMRYTLYLEDHMPVEGRKPFRGLNVF